jgi:phage replication-related protein YjqB (UPF0714/DUF867 family)
MSNPKSVKEYAKEIREVSRTIKEPKTLVIDQDTIRNDTNRKQAKVGFFNNLENELKNAGCKPENITRNNDYQITVNLEPSKTYNSLSEIKNEK